MAKLDDGFEEMPIEPSLNEGFQEVDDLPYMQGNQKGVNLSDSLSTVPTGQELLDFARGGAAGATLGGYDELVGGLKTAGGVLTGDVDPTKDLVSKYREYQKLEEAKQRAAEERSPNAFLGGQIAGGLATALPFAGAGLGASAGKTALSEILKQGGKATFLKEGAKRAGIAGLEMTPLGAAEGALSSTGDLSSAAGREQMARDAGSGAILGGVLGAGFKGAADMVPPALSTSAESFGESITKGASDRPYIRQLIKAREVGEQGLDYGSEAARTKGIPGQTPLVKRDRIAAEDITKRMYDADEYLGQAVGASLENATTKGIKIPILDNIKRTARSLDDYMHRNPAIDADPQARKAYFEMLNNNSEVTPLELKSIMNKMDDLLGSLEGDGSTLANQTRKSVSQFRDGLDDALKNAVPDYKYAANQFSEFRRLVPETMMSGKTPANISGIHMGSMRNQEKKMHESALKMIQGATREGDVGRTGTETLVNLVDGLKKLEQRNPGALRRMGFNNADEMEAYIKNQADEAAAYAYSQGTNPQGSALEAVKKGAAGLAMTGRGFGVSVANKYGKTFPRKAPSNPAKLSKNMYQSTDDTLRTIAGKLKSVPGLKNFGEALEKGVDRKDVAARNATIFTILQNPEARALLEDDENLY